MIDEALDDKYHPIVNFEYNSDGLGPEVCGAQLIDTTHVNLDDGELLEDQKGMETGKDCHFLVI